MLKSAVEQAVREVQETYAGHDVEVVEDGQGGARVRVSDLLLGDQYNPSKSWIAFAITFQYPEADVYPHFVGRLVKANGAALGESFSASTWSGEAAIQVSRRSNNRNQDLDTAAIKLNKVLAWIRSR
jgi:hypothetical protein